MENRTLQAAQAVADELEKRSQPGDRWLAVAARQVVNDLEAADAAPRRIRCTAPDGNVGYLVGSKNNHWSCVLKNGTPASFFYALGNVGDEQALKAELERATTMEARIAMLKRRCPRYTFDVI